MNYLKIQNAGELDIRLVSLMGGTTKSDKPHLIGEWGSGLKYTLAYLLRNNLDFHIFIGEEKVKIETKREQIKDTVFDVIYINGERSSITSNMGKDWMGWMIIRELHSNALDEGGYVREECTEVSGISGTTTFYIQIDTVIREVLNKWDNYFISENISPLFENDMFKIYNGGEKLRLYKQGVLIQELDKPSPFSYDVKFASLNELREFRGAASFEISNCWKQCEDEKMIRLFLEQVKKHHFEGDMDWNWYNTFNNVWGKTIENKSLVSEKVVEKMNNLGKEIPDNLIIVPDVIYDVLSKQFPYLSAVKVIKGSGAFYEEYDEKTENKVNQALTILESCDYYIAEGLEFQYGLFENRNVLAKVDIEDKKIMVSNTMMQKPLISVISMIIEENEHFNTGFEDHSRNFQQHFIDLYARQLLATNQIEI